MSKKKGDLFATEKEVNSSQYQGHNHGRVWDNNQHNQLRQLFMTGNSFEEIMVKMGRSAGSIIPKLTQKNLIVFDYLDGYRYNVNISSEPITQEQPEMSSANIENVTLIRGQNAAKLSDDEIFKLIAQLEQEMESLGAIKNKPKKLQAKIYDLEADINKLVEYVDGRE